LVRVRQRDDHHVRCRAGADQRQQAQWPEDPEHAYAARLQRHELAVRRHASETDENPEQQRHRNGDAERLGQQREQHLRDDLPLHPLFDELLAGLKNRRHLERECQPDEHQHERQQDFADQVAVENLEHLCCKPIMTRVAILWHMHQPFYEDLVTREHILPWVRLHALQDYYGMAALMREFPKVKVTFNLVPSMLVQLEAFAADRARDRYLELSLRPAADLSDGDIDFILENFFHAQHQRMIEVYPRYAELLALRGGSLPTTGDRRAAAARFTRDDLRDLQVWHKLAWI